MQPGQVSSQVLHLGRLHRPPEASPMTRSQSFRDGEVQALADRRHGAVPEQQLGTGNPPPDGPGRVSDDDGVSVTAPILYR
jgi:hypothetical protein